METRIDSVGKSFDKTNAYIAAFVFIFTLIIYRLTMAPTFSYWDCGEFIACSYILGIPHPPGSPLFILIGRIFSILPISSDICFRINILSIVSSAAAVLFGYLTVVRIIRTWYDESETSVWSRYIPYIGGVVGALFMAFATTYWANAVEAEVYGLSMMIMTMILWMMLIYYDVRGTGKGTKLIIMACYLGMLGVGVHLTTFLIMPIAAVFFILKKDAPVKAWIALCGLFVVELLGMIAFSNMDGGFQAFIFATVIFLLLAVFLVYKYINWPVLIGIAAFSLIMVGFTAFKFALILGIVAMLVIASAARKLDWKTGLMIILFAVVGFSLHLFIPIRSGLNPRIDENNPSRNFSLAPWAFFDKTQNQPFINYLDRKQYGSQLMVERSFQRRGTWAHQFGRHPHMGFWSYFETQYGFRPIFLLVFLLGLFGLYYSTRKRVQIGLPFLILLLLGTVGLVLYMNFADGIMYNAQTGDAYLEVRNRDYFFTPGFAYFGLALGLGAAALMDTVRKKTAASGIHRPVMMAMSIVIILPLFALGRNYFENDRSKHYYPQIYAENMLNTCEKDAILFTSGDNDTFPLWCLQEVYGIRKDVRVVNLSLFNTDWYVAQMKNHYGVPISLSDNQILWNDYEYQGHTIRRPESTFVDRPRKRRTYLIPAPFEGRIWKLQDMMVDEVVIENKWKNPIYFSSEPYAESPLKLRDIAATVGLLYKIDSAKWDRNINADEGYRLYKDVYRYDGLDNPNIYRDENATGVMLALGFNAIRLASEFWKTGQQDKAFDILQFIIEKYPEFLQSYVTYHDYLRELGDTAKADSVLNSFEPVVTELIRKDPQSQFYVGDLGLLRFYQDRTDEALALLWEAFDINQSSGPAYRKLAGALIESKRYTELVKATQLHADYKNNRNDPLVRQVLQLDRPGTAPPPESEDW
ncbi:MAG: DUF2723 domain-containing protein [Candidatus Zixiibacteriota bacterium]